MDASGLVRAVGGGRGITALSSERGLILPSFASALHRYVRENAAAWTVDPSTREAA
jgi:dTDP-4-dehydrorhamnose reductase